MTHEDFMGLKPGDTFHLTDEDRRRIENTLLWQTAKLREALAELVRPLLKTWPWSWLLRCFGGGAAMTAQEQFGPG